MMNNIECNISDWSDDDEIKAYLKKIIQGEANDGSGLVYGMGHAIYTVSDPRAVILKAKAESLAAAKGYLKEFNLYKTVERLTPEVFREVKGINKAMCANVDMYSGLVYKMLDIPQDLFTPLFAVARTAGWCAHRIEEISNNKIIRPAYKNISHNVEYIPMSERK